MNTQLARHAAVALLLALAAPARAQLGLDLTEEEKKQEEKAKKPDRKKPAERRAAPPQKAQPQVPPPAAAREPVTPPPEPLPKPARPADATTMPELDIGAGKKGEAAQRIADANRVLQRGDLETAALAYDAILRDPALAEVHDEARYQLAKSLARMNLNHSALARLEEILAKGPQGSKHYQNALEWLFLVGKRTVNEAVIVGDVARLAGAGAALPPSSQDEFNYLLARYAYERGRALEEAGQGGEAKKAYQEARRLASLVPQEAGRSGAAPSRDEQGVLEGDLHAKARFIDGLVSYADGNGQAAVDAFKDVVRLTNPRRGRAPDPRTRELAFLQLARIHYEHKQNRYAIFYYDKMPWGGESWLEGLWESSYAHYRIGDYEKALGNLLTLQSPYFREEWFPESWILKAVIYHENCRYPEARAILDEFHGIYEPVHAELDRLTSRPGAPSRFFDLLEDAQKGKGSGAPQAGMMRRILRVALSDRNVKRLDDSILEIEAEMDQGIGGRRESFRSSALARDLREGLAKERAKLVDEAGARARGKLEYERDGLRDLLQQALRIKIEIARKERETLEGTLTGGGKGEALRDYRYSVAVSDEQLYWPYDGEFWRDELGTYTYTLTKGCRDTGARLAAP